MKINEIILNFLVEKRDGFSFKEGIVHGKNCVLITPSDIKTKYTSDNELFRSCLVDKFTGNIYSIGFKKFVNFYEQPDFQPWDNSWPIEARHKLDGSLLCISKINGNTLCRTRGVFDASVHETGDELPHFYESYPKLFNNDYINSEKYTILCEHTTPNRIIVIREHTVPTLTLIGIISHETGGYMSQTMLDDLAKEWKITRPRKYEYNSVEECILDVDAWRGKEGVVLYSPDGQTLKKIKASEYCELHKIATGIKTVKQVMDVFIASPRFTSYEGFYNYIETTLDFEIAEKIKDDIAVVVKAYCSYKDKLERLTDVVNDLSFCDSRKEQALVITARYDDWRKSFAFLMLDKREIPAKMESDAIHQELQTLL